MLTFFCSSPIITTISMEKICRVCKISLPAASFNRDKTKSMGIKSICRSCDSIWQKNYRITRNNDRTQIGNKICGSCLIEKDVSEFNSNKRTNDGLCYCCRQCASKKNQDLYEKNKDKIKAKVTEYYRNNKDKVRPSRQAYANRKLKEDPKYKLTRNLRNRLYYALEKKSWKKNTHFAEYIGCDLDSLKAHLEAQFSPGMTWDNYGKWHIDHIIPLSSAKTPEEMYKLCHYTNLQPLWGGDNLSKGAKLL